MWTWCLMLSFTVWARWNEALSSWNTPVSSGEKNLLIQYIQVVSWSHFGAFFLTSLTDKCFIFRLHSCSVLNPSVLFTLCGNILIPLLNTSVNSTVEFLHFHFTKRFSELWLIIQDFCPEHISSWKMNVHHDPSRFNNVLDSSEPSFSSS